MSFNDDWNDFHSKLEFLKKDLKADWSDLLFRGVGDSNYNLYPEVLYPRNRVSLDREQKLFAQFETTFQSHSSSIDTSWQLLTKMEQQGHPTRFISWSRSFLTAYFYSVVHWKKRKIRQPAVYVLNKRKIQSQTRQSRLLQKALGVSDTGKLPNYNEYFLPNPQKWPYSKPVLWNEKIGEDAIAQRKILTFHGANTKPLNKIYPRYVRQLRVPIELIEPSISILRSAGISGEWLHHFGPTSKTDVLSIDHEIGI